MIKFRYFFAIVVTLCIIPYISGNRISAQPVVQVSPTCGPSSPGFEITVNSNGFEPNSNIKWKLVNSEDKIPYIGYFQSNSTGGFNDVTSLDDLIPGNYKLYFGTDRNELDSPLEGTPRPFVDITIPCSAEQQSSSIATASDNGSAAMVLLSQRLKTGTGGNNDIVGEVKNLGNDTAKRVRIDLTTYDNNGDVIGTDFTYSTVDTLKASQKSSFDLLSSKDNFINMKNYELSLQWRNSDGTDEYVENAQVHKDGNK
jgi:hypothetical protein